MLIAIGNLIDPYIVMNVIFATVSVGLCVVCGILMCKSYEHILVGDIETGGHRISTSNVINSILNN